MIFNIVFRFKVRKNIFQKLFLTGIQNGDARRDRAKKWNFKWYFLKTKQQFKKNFYQMSCMKDKYSIYAKKLSPLFPKSYFLDFPWWCCFPSGKTLGFRFFSLNSRVILKSSRPSASNFSILLSNLMKKISIQVFSQTENNTTMEKSRK